MKNILVIFGGRSAEHDVSIITGTTIIKSLESNPEFNPIPLYIAKNNGWYTGDDFKNLETFKDSLKINSLLEKLEPVNLNFKDGLTLIQSGIFNKKTQIHLAFPAMHGTYGEDGSLMGLLRLANIPYVGCDMASSVIAMDKVLTKQITFHSEIPTTPYTYFTKTQWEENSSKLREKINTLSYPLFVKPVHLGSSIGITRITKSEELENAVEVAIHFDNKVIVESAVPNLIEVTCLILGNESNMQTSLVERPLWNDEFLDFQDKYIHGGGSITKGSQETTEIPAKIDEELTKKVKEHTLKAIKAIGGGGIARCDFLINGETKEVFLNEINTLPGTLYMHNWKKSDISGADLVTKLVEFAEQNFKESQALTYTFESSILKNAGGSKKLSA